MPGDPTSPVGVGESFSFAHLTDAHLTSPDGAVLGELCNKRALSYLSWRRRRRFLHDPEMLDRLVTDLGASGAEHLAITGDLTNLGLPAECSAALHWLRQLAPKTKVSLVPGNHDRLVDGAWDETIGLWSDFMASDRGDSAGVGSAGFPTLRVRGPVAFIGLSSAVPTPPLLATGRLGDDQLRRLAGLLQATGQQGLFRVILIHHPPVPGAYKWRKRLVDAEAAAALIRAHGADLVLHGHTHRIIRNRLFGPGGKVVPVSGMASASSTEASPARASRYSLWTVLGQEDGGFRLTHRSRRYDANADAFVEGSDWDPLAGA
jgi:3',5'-cyclic AMP phosphodiesterase CpdA